jgi:hypothetical protein
VGELVLEISQRSTGREEIETMKHDMLARKSVTAPTAKTKAPEVPSRGLRIGEPNDAFEQEADRVANAVMTGGQTKLGWSLSQLPIGIPLRRKCACGGSGGAEGECEECKEKETLRRRAASPATPTVVPPIVHDALRSSGQSLAPETRAFFEPRFGHDFSGVRIHTGAYAAESARAVNALAYTVGREIVFGQDQHAPSTLAGRRLLAHELAHVALQSGQSRPVLQRQTVGGPLDMKFDPCVTLPTLGRVCGQDAAKACSKMPSLPGCGAVCKVFDCDKPKEPKTVCPPGFHAAGSKEFARQCCQHDSESARDCCPPDRIAVGPLGGKCCKDDEVVQGGACVPSSAIPTGPTPCLPPGRPTLTGKCCLPPLVPGVSDCETLSVVPPPVKPGVPTARPSGPVIINFILDRPQAREGLGALNSSLTSAGQASLKVLITQLKANPTWKVQLVGRASPEGTEDYNMSLGVRRARLVADAVGDAGIDSSRIADAPGSSLPAGCKPVGPGLKSCGEIGSKGESDRQVAATLFAP